MLGGQGASAGDAAEGERDGTSQAFAPEVLSLLERRCEDLVENRIVGNASTYDPPGGPAKIALEKIRTCVCYFRVLLVPCPLWRRSMESHLV